MSIQHTPEVTIIADSVSPAGHRIVTYQLRYWRAIHAEAMSHRAFSRNAGSSRARPTQAIIDQVRNAPWGPRHWGKNQPGMQATTEVEDIQYSQDLWCEAARRAADQAQYLHIEGVHKQVVNRVLEPFTSIDVVLTSTIPGLMNFFDLRCHPDAQPEIQDLAVAMRDAMYKSEPVSLWSGGWHLPYIMEDERDLPVPLLLKLSTARCARVSYRAFDGTVDHDKDVALYQKLVGAHPMHASPTEHQARPLWDYKSARFCGNFVGWEQHRKLLESGAIE